MSANNGAAKWLLGVAAALAVSGIVGSSGLLLAHERRLTQLEAGFAALDRIEAKVDTLLQSQPK